MSNQTFPVLEGQTPMTNQEVFEQVVEIVGSKLQWFSGEAVRFPGTGFYLKELDTQGGQVTFFDLNNLSLRIVVMKFGEGMRWSAVPFGIHRVRAELRIPKPVEA